MVPIVTDAFCITEFLIERCLQSNLSSKFLIHLTARMWLHLFFIDFAVVHNVAKHTSVGAAIWTHTHDQTAEIETQRKSRHVGNDWNGMV